MTNPDPSVSTDLPVETKELLHVNLLAAMRSIHTAAELATSTAQTSSNCLSAVLVSQAELLRAHTEAVTRLFQHCGSVSQYEEVVASLRRLSTPGSPPLSQPVAATPA